MLTPPFDRLRVTCEEWVPAFAGTTSDEEEIRKVIDK